MLSPVPSGGCAQGARRVGLTHFHARCAGKLWTRYHRAIHGRAIVPAAVLSQTESHHERRTKHGQEQRQLESREAVAAHSESLHRDPGLRSGRASFLTRVLFAERRSLKPAPEAGIGACASGNSAAFGA
jgi:hypothetical protein